MDHGLNKGGAFAWSGGKIPGPRGKKPEVKSVAECYPAGVVALAKQWTVFHVEQVKDKRFSKDKFTVYSHATHSLHTSVSRNIEFGNRCATIRWFCHSCLTESGCSHIVAVQLFIEKGGLNGVVSSGDSTSGSSGVGGGDLVAGMGLGGQGRKGDNKRGVGELNGDWIDFDGNGNLESSIEFSDYKFKESLQNPPSQTTLKQFRTTNSTNHNLSVPLPSDSRFGTIPLPSWLKEIQPHQWKAVEEIISHFENGVDVVFLDAPTGTGKTLIGELVRRLLEVDAWYVCSTKTLQDQFSRDFDYAKVLKGRSNYATQLQPFPEYTTADCTKTGGEQPVCNYPLVLSFMLN